jgi:transcriptional regulator with XRE-family HTH domain
MRLSPLRHPLAILRTIIQIGQKDLAELCGCSARAIQSVELGTLRLSPGLAAKIERATGADVGWLLDGDPQARPLLSRGTFGSLSSPAGVPYSKVQYDIWRSQLAELERGKPGASESLVPFTEVAGIHAILLSAIAKGQESLARYRITQFEKAFKEEFGMDEQEQQDSWNRMTVLHQLDDALSSKRFAYAQEALAIEQAKLQEKADAQIKKAMKHGREPTEPELEPGLLPLLNILAQIPRSSKRSGAGKKPARRRASAKAK